MKLVPIAEAKAHLSEHLRACRREPVVITRNGKASAMLVPVLSDEDLESLVIAHSPVFKRIMEESRKRTPSGKGVSRDEFWRRLGVSVRRRRKPANGSHRRGGNGHTAR